MIVVFVIESVLTFCSQCKLLLSHVVRLPNEFHKSVVKVVESPDVEVMSVAGLPIFYNFVEAFCTLMFLGK